MSTLHVVAELLEPEQRPAALTIEYSTTRIAPEAGAQLQRVAGVVQNDRSPLAEAYKMLRNQVLQRMRTEGHRVLAVTSPRAIEGKSLAAVNLALALAADFDTAVLLVDADFSAQGLQQMFGLGDAPGLSDHLSSGRPLPELFVNPGVQRLVFLPSGQDAQHSAELLATKAAALMMQELKARYADRLIVVDLPPLLERADALAFLPCVDTTLLVVEENKTGVLDVEQAAELLAPFNLIGSVLSKGRDDKRDTGVARKPWYRRRAAAAA